jgi:hypothetical protein
MLDQSLIVELNDRQRPDEDDERRRYYRSTAFGRSVAQAEATRLTTLLRQARAVGLKPGRAYGGQVPVTERTVGEGVYLTLRDRGYSPGRCQPCARDGPT